jgi:hypothetical protein
LFGSSVIVQMRALQGEVEAAQAEAVARAASQAEAMSQVDAKTAEINKLKV